VTVRVAVAAVAALAVVAAVLPAVEHAQQRRDDAAVRASVDRAADAVRGLYRRSDPGATVSTAPRRTVAIDAPADTSVAVARDPARLVVRRGNGAVTRYRLPIRVRVCGDRGSLAGPTTFAYVETTNGPVVVALRGFIRGDGSTGEHACTPRPRPADSHPRVRV
jgi:hypothetical protein